MLYEGLCIGDHGGHLGTTVLLDTGATSNFVSQKVLRQLSIKYHCSGSTLKLADNSEAPILGKVRLRLNIENFTTTVTCYVTDLCDYYIYI